MASKPENRFKEQKTYETFERDAKESGLYDTFAQEDLDIAKQDVDYGYRLLDNKKGYVNSKTEEGKQSFVDQAAYDRSQYQPKTQTTVPASTGGTQSDASANILSIIKQYDDSLPADKNSKWMKTIDTLFGQLAGDTFRYDAESDPMYALSQKYAKQAMDAQMAESAMLTGGYGNSYSAASGQQVYTDYMQDAAAELEQNAYNRWAAERDNKYNLLNIASQMEQQEYNRAQDAENTKYTRDWNEEARDYERTQDAENTAYTRAWNEEARDYERTQDAAAQTASDKTAAQERVLALLSMGGSVQNIPADLLTASGFTAEELAQYETYYKQQADADAAMQTAELAKIYASISGDDEETAYEPPLSYTTAYKQYYEEGDKSAAVLETLRAYGHDFDKAGEIDATSISQEELDDIFSEKGVPDYFRTSEYFVPFQRFEAERRANGRVAAKFGDVTKYFDDWLEYINAFSDFYAEEDPEDYRY